MKPVMQTELGEAGNCFSACLASVLEIECDAVPNFYKIGGKDGVTWWNAVRNWLHPHGFGIVVVGISSIDSVSYLPGVHIVSGESVRGVCHATLWEGGKLVHDPHPSGKGIKTIEDVCFLYPLDPAATLRAMQAAKEQTP